MKKINKKEKKMLIALGIVAAIGAISLFFIYKPDTKEPEIISESEEVEAPKEKKEPKSYSSSGGGGGRRSNKSGSSSKKSSGISMKEFQKHIKATDCWVLIDGEVYDISGFISEYQSYGKGAEQFCGTVGFEVGFLKENKIRDTIKSKSQKKGVIGS